MASEEEFPEALQHGLRRLFLSLDTLDPKNDAYYVPIFVITCWLLGFAVVFFDLAFWHISGRSITGSKPGMLNVPLMLLAWPFGAAFFGFVALVVHVLQPSLFGGWWRP